MSGGAPPERPLRVVLQGAFRLGGSLSVVNTEIAELLAKRDDLELRLNAPVEERGDPFVDGRLFAPRDPSWEPDVIVRHHWPPDFRKPPAGKLVMMQPWEFASIPRQWAELAIDLVDDWWAYTEFVRDTYVRDGVNPSRVHTVPLGVSPALFRPDAAPAALPTQKSFRFLFVGGAIARKGIDDLLTAYLEEFSRREDVCLVIKTTGSALHYRDSHVGGNIRAHAADTAAPEIVLIENEMPREELPGLFRACHALVHPYRGEGFGLPIAEAMACGLPAIVTGFGAALDFCTEDHAYLLPYEISHFPDTRVDTYETVDRPYLALPDRGALRKAMRRVFTHRGEALEKGGKAARHIHGFFTWDHTARVIAARLRAVAARGDDRESVEELHAAGVGYMRLGDLKRARRCFMEVLKRSPRHGRAHHNLGVIYLGRKELKLARHHFHEALEAHPSRREALLNLVRIAILSGDYPEALRLLGDPGLSRDPELSMMEREGCTAAERSLSQDAAATGPREIREIMEMLRRIQKTDA